MRKMQRTARIDPYDSPDPMGISGGLTAASYGGGYSLHVDRLRAPQRTPGFVYLLTTLSAIGGFLFGYDTGVISGAMILLRDVFHLSAVWQELVVGVTIGSAAIFVLIGGGLNDTVGRKPVIIAASLIFTGGAVCMAVASDRYMLLAGRMMVGAGIGFTSSSVPMYIAESAPAYVRGRLVSTSVVMIAAGQFVANLVGGLFSGDKENGWRYMLGLGAIPSAIQFAGFCFMPESPRWLITKGRHEKARTVLQKIRGQGDIEEEFDSILHNCVDAKTEMSARGDGPILLHMIKTPAVRRALIVGCAVQVIQQVAGINTVMYYSATIIKMSGVKDGSMAIWLSVMTAAVNLLFTIVGIYLVEKIGRRPLTLCSLVGAVISLVWLAIGFHLAAVHSPHITHQAQDIIDNSQCKDYTTCNQCMVDIQCGYCYTETGNGTDGSCLLSAYDNPSTSIVGVCNTTFLPSHITWAYDFCPTQFAWMPLVGLVVYLIFFAPGMGPMPWTINSEIYPLWARSTGNATASFCNWIVNLASSISFLSMTEALTRYGTFWLYAGLAFCGFIFLDFFLPETKGKTLEEVEGLFAQPWCGASENNASPFDDKTVQYVHIRGLNRDGRESEMDSPE